MTTRTFKIAGIVFAAVTATAHIFIGTYDTLMPFQETVTDPMIKGTLAACWHFISIFLAFSVWSFFKETTFAAPLAKLWVAFAVCFMLVGLFFDGLHGLLLLPQWVFLGMAGVLMLLGLRKTSPMHG